MTDRELLELAAKAAGMALVIDYEGFWIVLPNRLMCRWNPLTDDGDALRLAVKLRLQLTLGTYGDGLEVGVFRAGVVEHYENATMGYSIEEATRRAIVRAAAEIGRNMK